MKVAKPQSYDMPPEAGVTPYKPGIEIIGGSDPDPLSTEPRHSG